MGVWAPSLWILPAQGSSVQQQQQPEPLVQRFAKLKRAHYETIGGPPGLPGQPDCALWDWRRLLPVKRQTTPANGFTVDTRWPCRSALISLSCFFDTLNKWLCYWNEPPCLEKKDVECSLVECADRKGVQTCIIGYAQVLIVRKVSPGSSSIKSYINTPSTIL